MNIYIYIIISILVLISIFSAIQNFVFVTSEKVKESELENKIKNFISLIERISTLEARYFTKEFFLGKSNLTVEKNVLTIEIENKKFNYYLPINIKNIKIFDNSFYCISKKLDLIEITDCSSKIDGICDIRECKENSIDCIGPNSICIGDRYCNIFIGENPCNSKDCVGKNKKEGEKCDCDEECSNNLICSIKDEKRCCPNDKPLWCSKPKSGNARCMSESEYINECKKQQIYVVVLVPAFYSDLNKFKERANFIKEFTEKTLPFRENPSSLEILIAEENCPMKSEDDIDTLIRCGNEEAKKHGFNKVNMVGGILGICVGGDGCGGAVGYTSPGSGYFIHGYDMCTLTSCPSVADAVVSPHEIGHNFNLCEGYCYDGKGYVACYKEEKIWFGGYCGTAKIEQKFPYRKSATSLSPCGNCGPNVCCLGRILNNDPINSLDNGRDVMGPAGASSKRAFACDSYLAFKDVAISIYGFNLPQITDDEIKKCLEHVKDDTYP